MRELAVIAGSLSLFPLTFGGLSILLEHDLLGGAYLLGGMGVLLPLLAARRDLRFVESWLLASCIAGGYLLYGMEFSGTGREFSLNMLPTLVIGAVGVGVVLAAIGHVLGWLTVDFQRYVASRT